MNKLANRHQQIIGFLLVAIALAALPWVAGLIGNSWVRILNIALLYVMLALGLNIVVGFAGLLDLGYIAFYAVGAYVYGLLASPHLTDNFETIAALFPDGLHLSIWLMIPLGALTAALFGVLLGAPTLRLRGDYLAIVTLGFGEIIRLFLNNLNAPVNITNGPQGINMIEPVQIAGFVFHALSICSASRCLRSTFTTICFWRLPCLSSWCVCACKTAESAAHGPQYVTTKLRQNPWESTPAT